MCVCLCLQSLALHIVGLKQHSVWSLFRLAEEDRDVWRQVRTLRRMEKRLAWMDEPGAVLVDRWRYSITLWARGTPVDPHVG